MRYIFTALNMFTTYILGTNYMYAFKQNYTSQKGKIDRKVFYITLIILGELNSLENIILARS